MKSGVTRKGLVLVTAVYWFLLLYIIAALVFWFLSLVKQNDRMYEYRSQLLGPERPEQRDLLETERKRKNFQYIGEGATFLVITLVGAVFVYRATRRQIKLNNQQQNFMMAVTHELKTPIAVTQLNLETLQRHKLEPVQRDKILQNTLQETKRLNDLCNNILLASQFDAGGYRPATETIGLETLMGEIVRDYMQRFPARVFELQIGVSANVTGDPLSLRLAINNIIENAIKYSPREKPIEVQLETRAREVLLRISDQGPGIPDNEKQRVFEKFYRPGDENTRQTKGTGLGLYLSQRIIGYHGGHIELRDHTPSGSTFVIHLPTGDRT